MLRAPLLHFLLIGALLFALQGIVAPSNDITIIEVRQSEIDQRIELFGRQMGRPVGAREVQAITDQVVENALWLAQARALGLDRIDGVVRQRLVLNMRFLEGTESQSSDDELYARAIELGLDRSDTVVERRLIDRVQAILRAGVRASPPDEATLRAHYAARSERWREPPLFDLTHVYLSRDKRGDAARSDAEKLLERLRQAGTEPEAAVALGDPFLAGHRLRGATPTQIASRMGPEFAAEVEAGGAGGEAAGDAAGDAGAQTGRWIGPIDSAFGSHLVWIRERVESRVPDFEEVRARVLEDWFETASQQALRDQIARIRDHVEVRIVEDAEPAVPADADADSSSS